MAWEIYEKNLKFLMWLPLVLLVAAAAVLANNAISTGYFLPRSTELAGGKEITLTIMDADLARLESALPYATFRLSPGAQTLLVQIPLEKNETEVVEELKQLVDVEGEPSIKVVGPVLANVFFQQAQLAIVVAFVFMAIVVFLLFRSLVPSSIVVLAAITDLVVTMAVTSVIGVKLSLPVIAALLTIIGYSVDTDILLTTEMLKGSGETSHKIRRAVKTGLTLTATALAALVSMYFISGSFVLEEISLVLIIGLLVDMPATWFTNAGLLRKWMERKNK